MNIYETNEKLIALRERSGLSRGELASIIGIPYRTIQDWELKNRRLADYLYNLIEFRIEEAQKYNRILEDYMKEHNCTFEEVQKKYGIDDCRIASIYNRKNAEYPAMLDKSMAESIIEGGKTSIEDCLEENEVDW